MLCSICGKEISKSQLKYGGANGIKRENGKIVSRGFHHDCLLHQIERDRQEAESKRFEREDLPKIIAKASQ